jgi:hypothetical protein
VTSPAASQDGSSVDNKSLNVFQCRNLTFTILTSLDWQQRQAGGVSKAAVQLLLLCDILEVQIEVRTVWCCWLNINPTDAVLLGAAAVATALCAAHPVKTYCVARMQL